MPGEPWIFNKIFNTGFGHEKIKKLRIMSSPELTSKWQCLEKNNRNKKFKTTAYHKRLYNSITYLLLVSKEINFYGNITLYLYVYPKITGSNKNCLLLTKIATAMLALIYQQINLY